MNNLHIYNLPKNNNIDIFTKKNNLIILTPFQNKPLFSLGYHYFIGRTRDAMSITNKLESKNDFYYVVNPYEINIPNYDDNITNLTKIYLKQDIKSVDFYQMWEIFFMFDIIENNNLEFLILTNSNEGITDAIELFRNKFFSKKDKINKEYKKGINADIIISNYFSSNENDFVELLIEQIKIIIETQNKKGNLILKIYDTFTTPTLKLLYLITSLYDETYIYKPLFSRPSENDKYLICKNFNCNEKTKLINNLEEILNEIKNKNINYVADIFLDFDIPQSFLDIFKFTNIKLVNQQQILINEIVKYIKDNNYFGDKYHEFRNQQIQSTELWVEKFYPPSDNLYKSNKEYTRKTLTTTANKNNLEKEKFITQLI